MSYCITEINSFKIQSSPVRCFVAHRSYSKQTFKMTLAGRKGTEDESKWMHRMNLENWDGFKDSCELVAEGAGAGVPLLLWSSPHPSVSPLLMALFSSLYDIRLQQGAFSAWLTLVPHATRLFSLQVVCCREFSEGFRTGYAGSLTSESGVLGRH